MIELVKNLKKANTRIPYYGIRLPQANIDELEATGETIAELSMRYNYPVLTGFHFARGKMATVVSKTCKHGKYYYLLQTIQK